MDATKHPLKKRLGLALLAATLLWLGPPSADGAIIPDIRECGLVTNHPALPAYQLRNTPLKNTPLKEKLRAGTAVHDAKISLQLEGHGELLLQQYFYNPDDAHGDVDREAQVDWDHVAGRRVALGWLAGTTNLLLVSWRDLSSSFGTGHFEMQWYLVAQVERGGISVLLKKSVCSSGRARDMDHVQSSGIGQHYFSFDAASRVLTDRMTFSRALAAGRVWNPPPLHHEAKGYVEKADVDVANLRETLTHRYRYQSGKLDSLGVEMFYTTQPLDTPRAIAAFYFGPLAPASVILRANPELHAKFARDSGYEGGWFRLPADTPLRIPLPEEWITRFYE